VDRTAKGRDLLQRRVNVLDVNSDNRGGQVPAPEQPPLMDPGTVGLPVSSIGVVVARLYSISGMT
jgi:hypothetical protein